MYKEHKRQYKVNIKAILALLIGMTFFTLIVGLALMELAPKSRSPKKSLDSNIGKNGQSVGAGDKESISDREALGILKGIEIEEGQITFFDIETQDELVLNYTGASDIRDKFNGVISIRQIPIGTMVEIGYLFGVNKLNQLQVSTKAWEYSGSNNFYINSKDKIITVGKTKYKFTDDVVVINEDTFANVQDLAEQDQLTFRGYDQTIWSIEVTKGHGTVKITDVMSFAEGSITVGYEAMEQISEGLVLTVREGSFNLTAENGRYSATKNITVNRNRETVVTLSDMGPNAVPRGTIGFEIYPFGADLFIDGVLMSYGNPIELTYGEHDLEVSLGGYTPYMGTLKVDSQEKLVKINLPEKSSSNVVNIIETDNGRATDSDSPYNQWELPSGEEEQEELPSRSDEGQEAELEEDPDEEEDDAEDDYMIDNSHTIYIQNPVGASVYLNGDFMGISPGSFPKIIGNHVLTFIKEGYVTKSYTVEVLKDGLDTYLNMPDLVKTLP